MQTKQPKSRSRKLMKISGIIVGVLALVMLGLHIWFVNNARNLIKNIVAEKSHGKLKLELRHVSFNFFTNRLQAREAMLISTDSLVAPSSYRITFSKLNLKTGSFWSLLFHNRLALDSIDLHDPQIVVTQWRKDTASTVTKEDLSISQEMGKLYNSMLDGLDAFGIRRIIINNAKLTLINKIEPDNEPVVISNIYFNLLRSPDNTVKRDQYVENEQTVDLTTTNQNIALPGGRHRLAFSSFNLQLFNKRIELNNCTITAVAKDSTKSSYTIFFNKLLLVGVNFDALYRYNLIKADSVYCENPLFNINLNISPASAKKERPDPEKIIQELTGDLDLAFVGVKDAGIHINISGKKNRSLFNSNQDDFEMHGLHINARNERPVVVDRFDMLVRDYHLYNEDSSTAYTFDSIHFLNNKVILNNFSLVTSANNKKAGRIRDFQIPYFELTGLDWYRLIFEETVVAREAVLQNPTIHYVSSPTGKIRKKRSIFRSLQTLDDLITLNKISVINGQINMKLGPATDLNIKDANISLYSDRLLASTNNEGLRRAIDQLSFSNGMIRLNDITAEVHNARYEEGRLVHADRLLVTGKEGRIKATVNDVYIDNIRVDEHAQKIAVEGLKWNSAVIQLRNLPASKTSSGRSHLEMVNISGKNTKLDFTNGKITVASLIQSLQVGSLIRKADSHMEVQGLRMSGNNLSVAQKSMKLHAGSYLINSEGPSYVTGVDINQVKDRDSVLVKAPRVDFSADINAILSNDIHLTNLEATRPVVQINKWNAPSADREENAATRITVDHISLREPDLLVSLHANDSVTVFRMPFSANSTVTGEGLKQNSEGTQLNSLNIHTDKATLVKKTGEVMGVENGKVDLELTGLHLGVKNGKPVWAVLVHSLYLKSPNTFVLGNRGNKLRVDESTLGNLSLSSESVTDFGRLLKTNLSAWLRASTGEYVDSITTIRWHNAAYNSTKKTLSLDSFDYHPTQPRDSVMARAPYQTDYITLNTGPIMLTGFDLDKYEKDSALVADLMKITNPVITVYRDKKPPFLAGIHKPLPVDMIRRISFPVSVGKLSVIDGTLSYTEKHPKSRAEGTLTMTHMIAELSNVKNRGLRDGDSLLLLVNAYLMDSALIRLTVKESYKDTLSGFLMTLRLRPTTLSFLNPVLMPLSNVKITSGTIDSFQLRAIGQENYSIGEMQMFYHNLHIRLVKNGEETKSGLMGKIVSALVNTFLIKKNNKGRTGIIYFQRLKDRSFFNYIVKMTFSGMATSIGVKKNKKYLKQYRRGLKERNLPPLEFQ
jgi:hypothetical protein